MMLNSVKELGELISSRKNLSKLDSLIENPKVKSYLHALVIEIDINTDRETLNGVSLEELSDEKRILYLYRSGTPRGIDQSPTSKITEVEKTFENKILGWFKYVEDNQKSLNLKIEDLDFLRAIRKLLQEESKSLVDTLNAKLALLPKKENAILTIKINNKYIGEYELFTQILLALESLKDNSIGASDKVCSVCGQRKEKVSGNINTYKFYTIDKPGFITGGFDEALSWRNFPVCQDCKLALETGREFIESKLNFKFVYGLNYYLIPKFLLGTASVSEDIIDYFTNGPKKISLAGDTVKRITADENDILDLLKNQNDVMSVQFLFMRGVQSAERILLLIEDVYPSMLRKIFDAKEETDQTWKCIEREFNFGTLRSFFFKSDDNKREPDLDKYFLQIVETIFRLRPIDKHFILKFIMRKIRHDFNNDLESYHWTVLDGLVSVTFLMKLNLIKFKEVKNMTKSQFEDVFTRVSPMLSEPAAKGIFLLGALTKLLLNKQYNDRKSEPFVKQLKGLRLTERDIRGLLPKVQNKLIEYESFDKGKQQLAEEISSYLLAAGENWPLTLDEINFYFAAGMNLVNLIAEVIYPKQEEAV